MPMHVLIIKLKLPESERNAIEVAVRHSQHCRLISHGSPVVLSKFDCIVTKILTVNRLKRECAGVSSSEAVPVLRPDMFLDMLKTHATSPAQAILDALGTFARFSVDLGEASNLARASHASVPRPASSEVLSQAASHTSTNIAPTLVHEATEDPTSQIYSQSMILKSADSSWRNKYACQKRCPLVCPNQTLVELFKKIRLRCQIEGDERRVRSYSTVIASLKAYPAKIRVAEEVADLEGFGKSMTERVREYLHSGTLEEVLRSWQNEALLTKYTFWNVHGLGAFGVRTWYDERGYRDLNDAIQGDWHALPRPQQIGVKYYDDFLKRIPRSEVDQIIQVVHDAAQEVLGSESLVSSTCCGSYRRGKADSGDVDLVLTHKAIHDTTRVLTQIIQRLESTSFVRQTISERHERDGSKDNASGYAIGMVVCKLVTELSTAPMRRVDIIVCAPDNYITAILGWSGSISFERDLRLFVKQRLGLVFDSTGITTVTEPRQRVDCAAWTWYPGAEVEALERELFSFLGLAYIEPTFRNAD